MIDETDLKGEIGRLLGFLFERRFVALQQLTLTKLLAKNPYLYRSLGVEKPAELIERLMAAFVSSSDETIFGNVFLEPLAYWAACNASAHGDETRTAHVGGGAGYDVGIETSDSYLAVAVKSGKNIFNSQSSKGQASEFDSLQARMAKMKKQFRKIIGYSYGRKTAKKVTATEKVAGQAFWELITGEGDFYLRISRVIGELATEHAGAYDEAYTKKSNLLVMEFGLNFLAADGGIDWDQLVIFNSGKTKPSRLKNTSAKDKTAALSAAPNLTLAI